MLRVVTGGVDEIFLSSLLNDFIINDVLAEG